MKNEDKLLDAIGMIDEELIPEMPKAKESAAPVKHKKTSLLTYMSRLFDCLIYSAVSSAGA